MTKLEIVALERQNTGVVNLYAEGSFYKAYEQSAYVLCTYVRPLKVSARPLKGLDGLLLSVGFPMQALEKWTLGAEIKPLSDKCVQIHFPLLVDMSGFEPWRTSFQNPEAEGHCAAVRHPRLSEEYYPVFGQAYRMTKEVTEFLGAYLKPFRIYVSNHCLARMNKRIIHLNKKAPLDVSNSVNSYLGITSHFRAYNIRKNWIEGPLAFSFQHGYYKKGILSYRLYRPYRLHVTNKLLSYARPGISTRAA